MSKIKAFFYIFFKSLTSISYYKDVVESDKKLSFKYFFSLALLASVITAAYNLIPLIPQVRETMDMFVSEVVSMYEDDLVITLEDGSLSINRDEPYIVPVSERYDTVEGGPVNLLVIDVNGTVDDFQNKYDSYIMINSSNIMFQDSSGMRVESLGQIPDSVVTQQDVIDLSITVNKLLGYVPYILSVVLFLAVFLYYAVIRFIYLFVISFMLFAFGKLRGAMYGYYDYMKIAIHTLTLPLVIEVILHAFDVTFMDRYPMWFMAVNLVFGAVVIYKIATDSSEVTEQ